MGVQAGRGRGRASGSALLAHSCGGHVQAGWGPERVQRGPARTPAACFSVDKGTLWPEHEVTEAGWQLNDDEEWTCFHGDRAEEWTCFHGDPGEDSTQRCCLGRTGVSACCVCLKHLPAAILPPARSDAVSSALVCVYSWPVCIRWRSGKESTSSAGGSRNPGSIPGSRRSPGGGNGNPLQCSCLGNPTDRGAWWATVYGVTKSQTRLSG